MEASSVIVPVDMDELQDMAGEVQKVIERVTQGHDWPEEAFLDLALRLARAQRNATPVLAAFWKDTATRLWRHWRDIPPVAVESFKHLDLTGIPAHLRTRVFYSSGTTQQPRSRHWHHELSLQLYRESLKPWFARHVLYGDTSEVPRRWLMISLTPPPAAAPHSSLVEMLATVMETWGLSESRFIGQTDARGDWVLQLPEVVAQLMRLAGGGQPLVLMGTAFSFVHLLDYLREANQTILLPAGSRIMETGGYKGRSRAVPQEELHAALQQRLGVPLAGIVREYGMCELCSQAYDRQAGVEPAGPWRFRFPPWVRIRLLSPETGLDCPPGEPGLLCVYDLANVWSVMALQTSDLAVADAKGFELLGRAAAAEPRGCSLMVTE